ncbi:hypothetical protein NDU88_006899 [Pleurodeles waltl]|uniref:Uncharacterized protein n=1 Tax=Pleurodeles waltl TaxID=8319 RepID=A0AAV7SQY2_PLEWA|nr:hypothetical protein NDU88_006899 [Pleurodeles waltl]
MPDPTSKICLGSTKETATTQQHPIPDPTAEYSWAAQEKTAVLCNRVRNLEPSQQATGFFNTIAPRVLCFNLLFSSPQAATVIRWAGKYQKRTRSP